jgi:hypothetical protein
MRLRTRNIINLQLKKVLHFIPAVLDNFLTQLSALEKEDMSISGVAVLTPNAGIEQARQIESRTVDSVEHPKVLELVELFNSVKTHASPTIIYYFDSQLKELA